MKKFLFFLVLLPLFVFADGLYWVPNVPVYNGTAVSFSNRRILTNDFNTVQLGVAGVSHAVRIDMRSGTLFYIANNVYGSGQLVTCYIQDVSNGQYVNSYQYSILNALDQLSYRLWTSGFASSNVVYQTVSGNYSYFNINSLAVVSEALVSTNTAWRSAVLNGLASLSSDVRQLVLNSSLGLSELSGLGSSLDELSRQYSLVNSFPYALKTNFIEAAGFWYTDAGLENYDPFHVIGNDLFDSLQLSTGNENVYIDRFNALRGGYNSILQDAFKAYLTKSIADPNSVTNGEFESLLRNPSMAQEILSSSYSTPLTNALKKMTTDWKDATTNQLAQNTANITNQLAQWKRELKGHNDSVTNDLSKIGNSIGDVSSNTKSVADMLSGSSPSKAHVIVDNAVDVNVLNWPSEFHININANDLEAIISGSSLSSKAILDGVTNRLDNITNSVASLAPFFDAITNLQLQVNSSITNLDLSFSNIVFDSFHALLLDDYEDYITNGYFSSAVDTFRVDYPEVYSKLVQYGFSTEYGQGNFWSLFSSTLLYQSALVCGMLEDLATVRKFAEDHIEGGFQGGVTSLIDKFPSPTQLEDYLNQASNEVFKIQSASDDFQSAYSYMTNSAVSAFSPFRGLFSSVPENLVFFKTGNEQYITIPVSRGGNAWLVIRLCFSFALAAVNIILFPKFVLLVITLLSKLSKRFVKFVPTDR